MCSQGDLDLGLGLKIVKTCTFQRSPHMLDSTNICNPPTVWWSRFLTGRFIILKEDPALYPHTCLGPVTYMGTVVTKWAMPYLAWGSTLHTVEAVIQFVETLNKHSRRQVYKNKRERKHFPFTWSEPTQNILEGKRKVTAGKVLILTNQKLRHKWCDHKFLHILLDSVTNDKISILCILGSCIGHTNGQ